MCPLSACTIYTPCTSRHVGQLGAIKQVPYPEHNRNIVLYNVAWLQRLPRIHDILNGCHLVKVAHVAPSNPKYSHARARLWRQTPRGGI